MTLRSLIFVWISFFAVTAYAQTDTDLQLAQYYYNNGEFDKAVTYYQGLYAKSPTKVYFVRYFDCLIKVKGSGENSQTSNKFEQKRCRIENYVGAIL